jgi:hypothetical protein
MRVAPLSGDIQIIPATVMIIRCRVIAVGGTGS